MELNNIWLKRILAGLGLVILLFLVLDFNSRMAELTRLSSQFDGETKVLQNFEDEKEFLSTEIAYANSDTAIEKWAREQGRYIKRGDHPIIPLADPDYEEEKTVINNDDIGTKSIWNLWNQWLFGDLP